MLSIITLYRCLFLLNNLIYRFPVAVETHFHLSFFLLYFLCARVLPVDPVPFDIITTEILTNCLEANYTPT